MKNTPYTVPEGFFDQVQARARKSAGRIRQRRRIMAGASGTILALALVAGISLKSFPNNTNILADNISDQEIIEAYETDVFLNIFEY